MTAAGDGDGKDGDGTGPPPGGDAGLPVDDPVLAEHGIDPEDALHGDADDLEARVDDLFERARAAREAFVPASAMASPPDPDERAIAYCKRGLWPVIAVYVDRRGAGTRLDQPHHGRLETALNAWLDLYARCYGADVDPQFSVREAAELFVSTHDIRDVAQLLTDVPRRSGRQ